MPSLYYFAAHTDSGCLIGCEHEHSTVISAVACVSATGGYVVAVEDGQARELNKKEEKEFRLAMYGEGKTVLSRLLRLWLKPVFPDSN